MKFVISHWSLVTTNKGQITDKYKKYKSDI